MNDTIELTLYSPLQVDVIDQDSHGQAIPLEAVGSDRAEEYLGRIMSAFQALQPQEDARNAFTAPNQDWSEVCEKIVSLTRTVEQVDGRLYGVFTCRSSARLDQEELESLEWHCRDQWEEGWGEGYTHCPAEGPGLVLYIHYWQDAEAPLLTREELEAARSAPAVTEIDQDGFWTLIDQAKERTGDPEGWLRGWLTSMGPEQAKKFDDIANAYTALAYQYGLWSAASVMCGGCTDDGFMDFRAWLVAQGREVYLAALADPDSLAGAADYQDQRFDFLPFVGDCAYEELTGRGAYQDFDPVEYQALKAELAQDVVYGEGINYPYDLADIPAYAPRLCAKYLTPKEIRDLAQSRYCTWNLTDPDILAARRGPKSSRVTRKNTRRRREHER